MTVSTKPIAVFYHIWSPQDSQLWRLMVDEQLRRIEASGLPWHADVFCCISGPMHDEISEFVAAYSWLKVLSGAPDGAEYEGLTLAQLHEFCLKAPGLRAVAYLHTKGIRHLGTAPPTMFKAVNGWRHMLEWAVIDCWRDSILQLGQADVSGVNYRLTPWPHFSGNFWWARPAYVRSLSRPTSSVLGSADEIDADQATRDRVSFERWIGSNDPAVHTRFGFPFQIPGLSAEFGFNLYQDDIGPYYRRFGVS